MRNIRVRLLWVLFFVCLAVFPPRNAYGTPATPEPSDADFDDVAARVLPSVVKVASGDPKPAQTTPGQTDTSETFGSGVVIDATGAILTNEHVVKGMKRVRVTFQNGQTASTETVLHDPDTDLALIRLDARDATGLVAASFGNSDGVRVGQWVLAVGAPFGLQGSVTRGIISARGRQLKLNRYEDFLQTDAATDPGSSGGPLFDLQGKIIGINTAIRTKTGNFAGVGFAISSNLALPVANGLLHYNRVPRSYLGVRTANLSPSERQTLNITTGVKIIELPSGDCPAKRAGLVVGDFILSVDGTAVLSPQDLVRRVAHHLPYQTITLIVRRGQSVLTVTPELWALDGNSPDSSHAVRVVSLAASVEPVTHAQALRYGYSATSIPDHGLLLTAIDTGGTAAISGLEAGWTILEVEHTSLSTVADLTRELTDQRLSNGALLLVLTPANQRRYVIVRR
jgi:serine protease Do